MGISISSSLNRTAQEVVAKVNDQVFNKAYNTYNCGVIYVYTSLTSMYVSELIDGQAIILLHMQYWQLEFVSR